VEIVDQEQALIHLGVLHFDPLREARVLIDQATDRPMGGEGLVVHTEPMPQ